MPNFMILLHENDGAWRKLSEAERQALLEKYYAWVHELRNKDLMRDGNPLAEGGRVLRVADGEIVDGPYTETKEVITGYFLIEAENLDAATEIAKGCPALGHGETVVIRQTGHGDAS